MRYILTHKTATTSIVVLNHAECGCEEMCHPPYSPDLAPSDYHLFPNLKKHLRGQRFLNDEELMHATDKWLTGQSELFYFTGVEKLQDRYRLGADLLLVGSSVKWLITSSADRLI